MANECEERKENTGTQEHKKKEKKQIGRAHV